MTRNRSTRGFRAQWSSLALVVAVMTASAANRTLADELASGTATGSFRTGLTRAGLAAVDSLGDAHLWLGLRRGRDKGTAFDVRVELLNNGVPVASGLRRCVSDLAINPRDASEIAVPWSEFTAAALEVGDVLALRVSTRIGTNADDTQCAGDGSATGLRLFFDANARASGLATAITPDPSVDLYLRGSECSDTGAGVPWRCNSNGAACINRPGIGEVDLSLSEDAPNVTRATCQDSAGVSFPDGNAWTEIGSWNLDPQCDCANELIPVVRENPPAPEPETIVVSELPLPPAAPSTTAGSCDATVNPNGTGCIDPGYFAMQSGAFFDNNHVVTLITYAGAPAAPDPASIYSGPQLIAIKTDGTTFANGDPWKCITCGLDASHKQGLNTVLDYPQPFIDNTQVPPMPSVLWGNNIVNCSGYALTDEVNCTPANTFIYPIRWNQQGNGGGAGGSTRELRINPDGIHLGWNKVEFYNFCATCGAIPFRKLDQFGYLGRLSFNPAPTEGTPLVPRFDLLNVTRLYNPAVDNQPFYPDPDHPGEILFNPLTNGIGEFRAFTADGQEAIAINAPSESDNIDVFATNLATGAVRRLTRNPEYVDPIQVSPDDNWMVVMDTRGTGRQLFMAAMEGIPAINDLLTTGAVASVRNNGQRRFFQPFLIDRYGDRGSYQGQQLNAAGDGSPNAVNDPNWNGMADPWFSPDGTSIVYGQRIVTAPDCGTSPEDVPCPTYTNNGRRVRLMLATLTDRTPLSLPLVAPVSDSVPWGTPFTPGSGDCVIGANQTCPQPNRTLAPAGTWTLQGKVFGNATLNITTITNPNVVSHVDVTYNDYSDDGIHVINGTESVDRDPAATAANSVTLWHQNLTLSGCQTGTKVTSEPSGFSMTINIFTNKFLATGTLTTTIDGTMYTQPANGT